ncbi:MAG TPA: carbohydrate binding domain-containing protein [Pyrinomonadaceae bacterium]|jgi:tetratricopeptide (TPR) repeat protein|nr:carbohydrate binding domain-containing protein [Pyrinomonadaceae bacterium]
MRIALTILGIALCLFLIQGSARFGFSRLLSRYALATNSIPAADEALRLTPSDPEAHRSKATILNRLQASADAAHSLETATTLRFRDDYLWIELANTREELGDTDGALAALDQAVRWAPHYAHTHWQRGNLLLRMRRPQEAFSELRQAATANPSYIPSLVDLAWGISGGNIKTTEAALEVKDDVTRLALIRFLARKGRGREVVDQIRSLSSPLPADKQNEIAGLLFAGKAYREAFDLWRASNNIPSAQLLMNGGFEDPIAFNDNAFGWIIAADQKNRVAIDVSEKLRGARSLQITFDGPWAPGTSPLNQTIVVDYGKTYHLSFAVRTKDLVTGGPPILVVNDANNNQLLGQSENFPTVTTPWQTLNLNFTTLTTSEAVIIRLQRSNCDSSPCPIFGTLWLDEFHIEQTEPTTKR